MISEAELSWAILLDPLSSARVRIELPELVRSFQILIPAADSPTAVLRLPAPSMRSTPAQ